MGIEHVPGTMNRLITPVKNWFLAVSAVCLASMMFLTALDVAMRYVFNSPISGALEVVEYMMAVIVPFAVAVTAYDNGHIGVELVVERLPTGFQQVAACLTRLMALVLYALITWQGVLYILEEKDSGMTSAVLLIPSYPFVASVTVAFALFALITLMQFFESVAEVTQRWTHS